MARGGGGLAWIQTLLLAAVLVVLGVVVFQLDTVERRFIAQSTQLAEVAEALRRAGTPRAAQPDPAPAAGATARGASDGQGTRAWRHPEVENFLRPAGYSLRTPETKDGGRIVRWYGTDPKGFNVLLENAADVSDAIWAYVGAALAQRQAWTNPDLWQGEIAERVEITNEGREFTIYLRSGVRWHAPGNLDLGDPKYAWLRGDHFVTARDVAFSLALIRDPKVENAALKNYYEDVEGIEVIDDHTLVVRWAKTFCGAVEATLSMPILPEFIYAYDEDGTRFAEETLGTRFNQHWYNHRGVVGAGPYRFVSYQPGSEIRLERFDDYAGERPAIAEIVYAIFADPNAAMLKLEAHELTFGGLRPAQYRERIGQWKDAPESERPANSPWWNGDLSHTTFLDTGFYYIGWNADRPLFADRRVRRAMTLAFDRQGIIDSVFEGLGEVAVGPYPAQSPFHDPAIAPLPFDLDAARALLREAGFEDTDGDGVLDADLTPTDGDATRTPFEFSLLVYNSSPEMASTANIYQQALLRIGVRMHIESAEWSLMQKRMDEKEFDAFTGGWALGWEQDPYQVYHSSQADLPKGSNRVGFRNAEADRILEELRRTCAPAPRTDLLRRFHRILHDEQPYSFFYVPRRVAAWWQELKHVEFARLRPQASSLPWWIDAH